MFTLFNSTNFPLILKVIFEPNYPIGTPVGPIILSFGNIITTLYSLNAGKLVWDCIEAYSPDFAAYIDWISPLTELRLYIACTKY